MVVSDVEPVLEKICDDSSVDAYATAKRLSDLAAKPDTSARYPSTALAKRLRLVARLIKSEFGTRVFYAVQSGYDTHAAQLVAHSRRWAICLAQSTHSLKTFSLPNSMIELQSSASANSVAASKKTLRWAPTTVALAQSFSPDPKLAWTS
jgi:hypothetical protein